jgi:magnesium transporter
MQLPNYSETDYGPGKQVVNCIAYQGGRRLGVITIEDISETLKKDGVFVWVGLHEPDEVLLRKIQAEFGLHELAIEDAHAAHQRPKLEEYGSSLFIVLKTAQMVDETIYFGETHIFVGTRFIVTVRHGPSLSYAKVREHCETIPQRLTEGTGFALYTIMDFVVDNYRPMIDIFEERLKKLEADTFQGNFDRSAITGFYNLKRNLLDVRNAIAPLSEVCLQLMRLHPDITSKDTRVYFRDIHDHITRIVEATDNMREVLTTAMQVNLALVSVRQNEVVKRLAGWGAILAIPTMIFSLYGMNFEIMPELKWRFGYPLILGVIGAGCILLYRKLKRAGWL